MTYSGSVAARSPDPFAVVELGRRTSYQLPVPTATVAATEAGSESSVPPSRPWCLLVPLGATEQHGPHLPLSTDTIIAHHWAAAAAVTVAGVVVAPPLPYGSSGEHQGFPGTISIGRAALEQVLVEIVRSAAADYELIVLVSGHGGNVAVVQSATSQLEFEGHSIDWVGPAWTSQDRPGPDEHPIDAHAGHTETSIMLHLRPDLVEPFDQVRGNTAPLADLMPILKSEGLAAATESGVLGDPAGASPSHGQRLFNHLVEQLTAKLRSHQEGK